MSYGWGTRNDDVYKNDIYNSVFASVCVSLKYDLYLTAT